jgi:hypothetical protein
MRFIIALILLIIVLGSQSSRASEAPSDAAKPEESAHEPRASGGPLAGSGIIATEMPALIAPVVANGELHYYVYLAIRLELNELSQRSLVLDKVPYLQDAFLREVHRASIALDNDPNVIDGQGLMARLTGVCEKVLGGGVVKRIEFRNMVRVGE